MLTLLKNTYISCEKPRMDIADVKLAIMDIATGNIYKNKEN